jgi:ribosomal protein S17E
VEKKYRRLLTINFVHNRLLIADVEKLKEKKMTF